MNQSSKSPVAKIFKTPGKFASKPVPPPSPHSSPSRYQGTSPQGGGSRYFAEDISPLRATASPSQATGGQHTACGGRRPGRYNFASTPPQRGDRKKMHVATSFIAGAQTGSTSRPSPVTRTTPCNTAAPEQEFKVPSPRSRAEEPNQALQQKQQRVFTPQQSIALPSSISITPMECLQHDTAAPGQEFKVPFPLSRAKPSSGGLQHQRVSSHHHQSVALPSSITPMEDIQHNVVHSPTFGSAPVTNVYHPPLSLITIFDGVEMEDLGIEGSSDDTMEMATTSLCPVSPNPFNGLRPPVFTFVPGHQTANIAATGTDTTGPWKIATLTDCPFGQVPTLGIPVLPPPKVVQSAYKRPQHHIARRKEWQKCWFSLDDLKEDNFNIDATKCFNIKKLVIEEDLEPKKDAVSSLTPNRREQNAPTSQTILPPPPSLLPLSTPISSVWNPTYYYLSSIVGIHPHSKYLPTEVSDIKHPCTAKEYFAVFTSGAM